MKEIATPDATTGSDTKNKAIRLRKTPPSQQKPFPDFPLNWHKRGYWRVKKNGKEIRYEADWQASYQRYLKDKEAWEKGELAPSQVSRGHMLQEAIDLFMDRQLERMDAGEISDVQLAKYRKEMDVLRELVDPQMRLSRFCGDEAPALFARIRDAAIKRGLVVAERHIYYVRKMFDFATKRGLMPPAYYGENFDKPSASLVARKKIEVEQKHGERAWSIDELRDIVHRAWETNIHLFAQTMLGLNCGFGADDCALLRESMLERDKRLIRAYRGKTFRKRICPLWIETLDAIDASRADRPEPADPQMSDRIFLTKQGLPVARKFVLRDEHGRPRQTGRLDSIRLRFERLLDGLDEEARVVETMSKRAKISRPKMRYHRFKVGFYTLRAMFRSLAVGCGVDHDLIAVVKGQKFARPVDEYYLRGDLRAELFRVTDHVYWALFAGWSRPTPWSLWPRQGEQTMLFTSLASKTS